MIKTPHSARGGARTGIPQHNPHLREILRRIQRNALYDKQEVIVDCGWYSGIGVREPGDRHYLSQPPDPKRVREWMKTQASDGSWPEIPYTGLRAAEAWTIAPHTHLCWLLALAEAYHHRDSPWRRNPRLLKTILRAFDFWCLWDFQPASWWWLMIGIPRWLYKITALMEPHLTPASRQKALEIIARADGPTPWGLSLRGTAQNQIWAAENVLALGCLENDPQKVRRAVDLIAGEIAVRPGWGEGLQADFSFHQHGNTLYSGGYGFYFAVDAPRLALLLHDTPYAFPPLLLDTIARYLLDHQQWLVRGLNYAYPVVGREIARPGKNAWLLPAACRTLAQLPLPPHTLAALHHFTERMAGRPDDLNKPRFAGNRLFWRSDFMAHQRPDFHASVKLHSRRLLNTDVPCNQEGLQNHHLSDGAFCLMRHGREYADLFPAWNWRRIPGTTTLQLRPPLDPHTPIPTAGRRDFAGGASDGIVGCLGYDFAAGADPRGPDQIRARKSWFFFGAEIVALGAGISASTPEPVLTTLNQCRGIGPVLLGDGRRHTSIRRGPFRSERLKWIHHDQVAYLLLQPAVVEGSIGPVAGDWNRINGQIPSRPVRDRLFDLGIPHGIRPRQARYAYLILPGCTPDQADLAAQSRPVEILANTPRLQAIRHRERGIIQAVFYRAGVLRHAEGWSLQVDRPCALILHPDGRGNGRLTVGAPDHSSGKIRIQLRFFGYEKSLRLTLPDGNLAGRSVTRILP